jgi:hypothetical protein
MTRAATRSAPSASANSRQSLTFFGTPAAATGWMRRCRRARCAAWCCSRRTRWRHTRRCAWTPTGASRKTCPRVWKGRESAPLPRPPSPARHGRPPHARRTRSRPRSRAHQAPPRWTATSCLAPLRVRSAAKGAWSPISPPFLNGGVLRGVACGRTGSRPRSLSHTSPYAATRASGFARCVSPSSQRSTPSRSTARGAAAR